MQSIWNEFLVYRCYTDVTLMLQSNFSKNKFIEIMGGCQYPDRFVSPNAAKKI